MPDDGNGNTLLYRVNVLERELEKLEQRDEKHHLDNSVAIHELKRDIAVLTTELHSFMTTVTERLDQLEGSVNDDVKGLRKVLIGAGSAVLIAALTFAITSLAVFGGPGG